MKKEEMTQEELAQLKLEMEKHRREWNKIHIDLIGAYNHEIIGMIGTDLQQLLVILYLEGDDFAKRKIQEYCYKMLRNKNKLWEGHRGDYHNIKHLENSKL